MNVFRRIHKIQSRSFGSSRPRIAMKPGTPIAGLDFLKNQEPVVAKERSEYPEWINNLTTPLSSLAKLKKMDIEEASKSEQYRYLKLTRRNMIKDANIDAGLR